MTKVNFQDVSKKSGKEVETTGKNNQMDNEKGYFEFLKAAKQNQRTVDEPAGVKEWLLDDSDYNAIFMTF